MPHQPVPPKNRRFARAMRREMTEAEEKLWSELRNRRLDRIKFRRQVPIGNYIADFVCLHSRLIVELDGKPALGIAVRCSGDHQRLRHDIEHARDVSLQPWR